MAKIEIEWLADSYECDTCGFAFAEGAVVRIDDEVRVELRPRAHCQGGDHFPENVVYRAVIEALGHEISDSR